MTEARGILMQPEQKLSTRMSPQKGVSFVLVLFLFMTNVLFSQLAKADITGFFEISAAVIPQTTSTEISGVELDFENNLNLTIQIAFFGWSFHGHGGITGLEDIITSFFILLGPTRIEPQLVMAQAFQLRFSPSGLAIPVCIQNAIGSGVCEFMFVSYRLINSLTLGGVTVKNLAIYEDTTFPNPTSALPTGFTYGAQSQSFGFGDVISFEGQTQSGILIKGATGLCAENNPKRIKKHSLPHKVNPHCAWGSSSPLPFFFDFETLSITGIPIATGVIIGTIIECTTIFKCLLTNTLNVNTGPLPFSASVVLSDLLSLDVESVAVSLTQGSGTLTVRIGSAGSLSLSTLHLSFLISSGILPARISITLTGAPTVGITEMIAAFTVTNSALTASAIVSFTGMLGVFEFSRLVVATTSRTGIVTLDARASFAFLGLESLSLLAHVPF